MRAMQVCGPADGITLCAAEIVKPVPGAGEVLIRVHAAGVTHTELEWYPTTHLKNGAARVGAVPGHEFSGVVEALGDGVTDPAVGQEVYGMNDWFADGATAEFCVTVPQNLAAKPSSLTHVEAASVPIGALTAWQGLFDHGRLQPGQRVLVHGGAGGVGIFAVQLAHRHGAHVIATASAKTLALVKGLGADEVIDYRAARFEESVQAIDVVFDTVGGETRERSWAVMKPEGRMITIAADGESSTDPRVKENYFIVEAKQDLLKQITALIDAGELKTYVKAVVPLPEAASAYSQQVQVKPGYGKVVVEVA